jgi:lactoylglutathione lyase
VSWLLGGAKLRLSPGQRATPGSDGASPYHEPRPTGPALQIEDALLFGFAGLSRIASIQEMKVERVKYIIWAADLRRAVRFYRDVLGGEVVKESEVISEVLLSGATIGIHSGGEGARTWTGLTFQVSDVISGAREVVAGGGQLSREPQPEGDEPPHLAMCIDPEGNEFMLTRKR